MNKLIGKISQYITTALPEMTTFCSQLIQTPSVNGVHPEIEVAQLIAERAQSLGLHVQMVGEDPQRPNLIISTAATGTTGLLLVGHLDTVPGGEAQHWSYPPFSGHITEDKIFGRGAIDTKGGITAALYALAALNQVADALPAGRCQLICVPDEESGATGRLGIKYLTQEKLLQGLGAIYAYSGQEIALGHRGLVRYQLIARGQADHTGSAGKIEQPPLNHNAVTAMADLLLELEQVDLPFSEQKYFNLFRPSITPGTIIKGGTAINMVPDYCEASIDVRTIPEFNYPRVEHLLTTVINLIRERRPGVSFYHKLINHLPPAISDDSAPLFSILEEVVTKVTGHNPERVISGPANEGYLFIEQGIPIVCGFGPNGAYAHAADEHVEIESLAEAAIIFCLTANKLSQHLS